ncbi:MAG: hypothetical protein IVW52_17845 [Acidimicrobiales bacterium]|nr:hypothetical protein [Acidimicrobiales bacterium]
MISANAQRANIDAAVAFIDRTGTGGDPIVSTAFFENPLSELDVALADSGSATYTPGNSIDLVKPPPPGSHSHPVLRLGIPPLAEEFRFLAEPKPQPVFFGLPLTPPGTVATQAVALAHHGTVFLVSPYANISAVLKYSPNSGTSVFVRALPRRFHLVQQITYPSFSDAGIGWSVYVFRDS